MAGDNWKWKGKDGNASGLLYESGNWGDLLKMLWVAAVLEWKAKKMSPSRIDYFDPFAGQASYPLGAKTLFRYRQARLDELAFINAPYIDQARWPSSASAALLLDKGKVEVFEANADRLGSWADSGATVLDGASGWELAAERETDPGAVWLLDPYDFLAEWREWLPMVADKARTVTTLVYIYNRAAGKPEQFAEYRAFRNRLDDMRGDMPKRFGRAASDAFLPRAHHEMLLLPGAADADAGDFAVLSAELEARTEKLAAAVARAGAFDN